MLWFAMVWRSVAPGNAAADQREQFRQGYARAREAQAWCHAILLRNVETLRRRIALPCWTHRAGARARGVPIGLMLRNAKSTVRPKPPRAAAIKSGEAPQKPVMIL